MVLRPGTSVPLALAGAACALQGALAQSSDDGSAGAAVIIIVIVLVSVCCCGGAGVFACYHQSKYNKAKRARAAAAANAGAAPQPQYHHHQQQQQQQQPVYAAQQPAYPVQQQHPSYAVHQQQPNYYAQPQGYQHPGQPQAQPVCYPSPWAQQQQQQQQHQAQPQPQHPQYPQVYADGGGSQLASTHGSSASGQPPGAQPNGHTPQAPSLGAVSGLGTSQSVPTHNSALSSTAGTAARQAHPGRKYDANGITLLGTRFEDGTNKTQLASTLAQGTSGDKLLTALENMAQAEPPELFAGKYLLHDERAAGSQAVVNFARDGKGGFFQYAIKALDKAEQCRLFHQKDEFEREVALYRDPLLKQLLPELLDANDNADGQVRSRSGVAFVPYMVLERGVPLADWTHQQKRGFGEIFALVESLTRLLATLHGSGRVHRDLKPDNILFLLHSTKWRLLDFGIVANAGEVRRPACTLPYAPPEVILAVDRETTVAVHPSHDIWSLAVIAYEAITQEALALKTREAVFGCAAHTYSYPWEAPPAEQLSAWRRSKVRPLLTQCLARDPAARPTAAQLLAQIERAGSATFTMA